MNVLLMFLAFLGHLALWVGVSNRIGATGWDHRVARLLRKSSNLALVGVPLLGMWFFSESLLQRDWWREAESYHFALATYLFTCWIWFAWCLASWTGRRLRLDASIHQLLQESEVFLLASDMEQSPANDHLTDWLTKLPGNQVLSLEVNRKQLVVPAVPEELAGLTITHFTDIHVSRRFTRDFYEQVFDHVNRLKSEIIVLTGDLVDLHPVPDWVPDLYSQLVAPQGVFFIFGNHDFRQRDAADFRAALVQAGLIDLGTASVTQEINKVPVDFYGNECPWSGTVAQTRRNDTDSTFSIGLTHSPDQFRWAQQQQVDLLLAGHMHGGQIRFPFVGPIVAPSHHGVAYSAGCFRKAGTTMHVSRGAGGLAPLRWNCLPEITQLEIQRLP